jgi:hypothetical protein
LVSGIGENLIDAALYAMDLKKTQLENVVAGKMLKTAMETQKAMAKDLLESMGIGVHIDTHV